MPRAEGRRFVNAAKDVARTVRQCQTPERSSAARVLQRTAVALPIIKANQPLASGRHRGSFGIENLKDIPARALRLGRLDTGKMLTIPIENRPRSGLTAF